MIATILAGTLLLGQSTTTEIKAARNLSNSANKWTDKNSRKRKMFMSMESGKSWVPMKSENDHLTKDGMWNEDVKEVAYVWVRDGRTLQVNLTSSSPSGDWAHVWHNTYRRDGSLARVYSSYNAFSPAEGCVVREIIFSPKGKVLLDKTSYSDLDRKTFYSGEKAAALKEYAPAVTPWLTVRELPFVSLMGK